MKNMKKAHRTAGAQARRKPRIPSADAANAISVSDGTFHAGSVVPQDGGFYAFDATGVLIGRLNSQAAAISAVPCADAEVSA